MDDLLKNRKKILINMGILLILSVLSIILIIGAAPQFKSNVFAIVLLLLFLIEIPAILSIGFTGLQSLNSAIENEDNRQENSLDALEELEKNVEEKAKEADNLTFNINRLEEDMGKFDDWKSYGESLLKGISQQIEIVTGLVYYLDSEENIYKPIADYAYYAKQPPQSFIEGDGLAGQVVKDKKAMFIDEIPEGYINVISGLGHSKPKYLAIIPIIDKEDVIGVLEIATFKPFERSLTKKIEDISGFLGKKATKLG